MGLLFKMLFRVLTLPLWLLGEVIEHSLKHSRPRRSHSRGRKHAPRPRGSSSSRSRGAADHTASRRRPLVWIVILVIFGIGSIGATFDAAPATASVRAVRFAFGVLSLGAACLLMLRRRDQAAGPAANRPAGPAASAPSALAGWYPVSSDTRRYWDGANWTEHVAPAVAPSESDQKS